MRLATYMLEFCSFVRHCERRQINASLLRLVGWQTCALARELPGLEVPQCNFYRVAEANKRWNASVMYYRVPTCLHQGIRWCGCAHLKLPDFDSVLCFRCWNLCCLGIPYLLHFACWAHFVRLYLYFLSVLCSRFRNRC